MGRNGFSFLEVMMILLLVAILAAVAVPQFLDFRMDTKNAAVQNNVNVIRKSIGAAAGIAAIRCGFKAGNVLPPADIEKGTLIAAGGPCTASQIDNPGDELIFPKGVVPENPWSGDVPGKRSVAGCVGDGCNRDGSKNCAGNPYGPADGGWCVGIDSSKPTYGQVWANSKNNKGPAAAGSDEYTY